MKNKWILEKNYVINLPYW